MAKNIIQYKNDLKWNKQWEIQWLNIQLSKLALFFFYLLKLSDKIAITGGYRILEGVADKDEVYNFALFHYESMGLVITL